MQGLLVRGGHGGPIVEVALNVPARPVVSKLDRPARIVLDFRNAVTSVTRQVPVQDVWLHRVRIAQFQRTPPIARMVLEVGDTRQMPEISFSGNTLVIRPKAASNIQPSGAGSAPNRLPDHSLSSAVQPSAKKIAPAEISAANPVSVANEADSFQVTFGNGLLTVVAENSPLGELIAEIASRTGINFQVARGSAARAPVVPDAINDRIQAHIGPGEPHKVIQTLLRPSAFRYTLVRLPDGTETVVLVPKQARP